MVLDLSDSLIIVTSDHASALVYSGFATPKESSILGMDKFVSNIDKKPYQLLTYSSGLGHNYYNETTAMLDNFNSYHKATIPSTWANHGGDDVPLYAVGPLANILFSGSMDQTFIPHAIAFAMCLFDYQDRCHSQVNVHKPEMPRFRKPNKIHLLKQKLQKEIFREQQNELDNLEASPTNVVNSSDFEFYLTSDLIGNSTFENSGKCKVGSTLVLVTLLIVLISIASS